MSANIFRNSNRNRHSISDFNRNKNKFYNNKGRKKYQKYSVIGVTALGLCATAGICGVTNILKKPLDLPKLSTDDEKGNIAQKLYSDYQDQDSQRQIIAISEANVNIDADSQFKYLKDHENLAEKITLFLKENREKINNTDPLMILHQDITSDELKKRNDLINSDNTDGVVMLYANNKESVLNDTQETKNASIKSYDVSDHFPDLLKGEKLLLVQDGQKYSILKTRQMEFYKNKIMDCQEKGIIEPKFAKNLLDLIDLTDASSDAYIPKVGLTNDIKKALILYLNTINEKEKTQSIYADFDILQRVNFKKLFPLLDNCLSGGFLCVNVNANNFGPLVTPDSKGKLLNYEIDLVASQSNNTKASYVLSEILNCYVNKLNNTVEGGIDAFKKVISSYNEHSVITSQKILTNENSKKTINRLVVNKLFVECYKGHYYSANSNQFWQSFAAIQPHHCNVAKDESDCLIAPRGNTETKTWNIKKQDNKVNSAVSTNEENEWMLNPIETKKKLMEEKLKIKKMNISVYQKIRLNKKLNKYKVPNNITNNIDDDDLF